MTDDDTHERIKIVLAFHNSSFSFIARDLIYQYGKGARCNGAIDAEHQGYGVRLRGLTQARLH